MYCVLLLCLCSIDFIFQRAVIPRSIVLIIERELMRGMVGEDETLKIQKKRRESGGKRRHSKESET